VAAAVSGQAVRYISIDDCAFEHLGAWGIELGRASKHNRIVRNSFYDLGGGGVKIGETINRPDDLDEAGCTVITDNQLKDGSAVYLGSPAIWVGQSSGNTISHNEIEGSFMWGISLGWNWSYMPPNRTRDNVVEYNHIHHLGTGLLGMHGAIYTLGVSPGTVVRSNYIHDLLGNDHARGWGIILDNGSAGILVENNVVFRALGGAFNTNFNTMGNIVQNNIFAFGQKGQLQRYGDPPQIDPAPPNPNIFQRNIVYFNEGPLYADTKWLNYDMVQDYNLFYKTGGHALRFLDFDFDQWKSRGLDIHSVVADPLFVDCEAGNFGLRSASPAFSIGFKPIDVRQAGPRTGSMSHCSETR
jgi:hypothetical protein